MSNDRYTKAVLTVIALFLGWLCALTTNWPVHAQQATPALAAERPLPVVIVGWGAIDRDGHVTLAMSAERGGATTDPSIPVRVTAFQTTGPIDVRLDYSEVRPMPVGITMIKPAGEWAPIRSAVEPEPPRSKPGR